MGSMLHLSLSILCMVFCCVTCVYFQSDLYKGSPCRLQVTEKHGVCKLLTECPSAIAQVQKHETPQICAFEGDKAIVCCPEVSAEKNISKSIKKCYEYIKGVELLSPEERPKPKSGARAVRNEFPHMALLGYGLEDEKKWLCGATLISERYLLTTAHCTYTRIEGTVRWIKVGLLKRDDTEGVEEYSVEQVTAHPDYKPPSIYNDIALLRTDRTVIFGLNIRPACLYSGAALPGKSFSVFKAVATGWGKTNIHDADGSNQLLKVTLEEFNYEQCNNTYWTTGSHRKMMYGVLPELMLCYGSYIHGDDTCQGDSGGPLQLRREGACCSYDLIGITSFGLSCGRPGVPGIYVNVSHYVPWIENIVWP